MENEEKEKPGYYAILVATVRYDKRLSANEKLLYAEITALTNSFGFCMASNNYFAELYGVSVRTVSTWINNLKDYEYIKIEIDEKSGNKRKIFLAPIEKNFYAPIEKNFYTPIEKNFYTPPINNINNNITRVNKRKNNKKERKSKCEILYEEYRKNKKDSDYSWRD